MAVAKADITAFMLLKIDLPNSYEDAIVATEVTNQERLTYLNQRVVAETKQKTENIIAGANAKIIMINANATAIANAVILNGQGAVANQTYAFTKDALNSVATELKFDTDTQADCLLSYYQFSRIAQMAPTTQNKLFVGSMDVTIIN